MKIINSKFTDKSKHRPKPQVSSEHFLRSINRLASRDSFSLCEPKKAEHMTHGLYTPQLLPKGVFKNFGTQPSKICTRCDTPLVVNSNINEYRFNTSYFMCSSCFKIAQQGYNKKRVASKKPNFSIEKRRSELQEQIKYLMDELNYLNEASRYS